MRVTTNFPEQSRSHERFRSGCCWFRYERGIRLKEERYQRDDEQRCHPEVEKAKYSR